MVVNPAVQCDPNPEQIVQEAARRIEAIIRTFLDRGAPFCCLMGGMSDPLREWMTPSIRERLRDPLGDALDGAILLARSRAGK